MRFHPCHSKNPSDWSPFFLNQFPSSLSFEFNHEMKSLMGLLSFCIWMKFSHRILNNRYLWGAWVSIETTRRSRDRNINSFFLFVGRLISTLFNCGGDEVDCISISNIKTFSSWMNFSLWLEFYGPKYLGLPQRFELIAKIFFVKNLQEMMIKIFFLSSFLFKISYQFHSGILSFILGVPKNFNESLFYDKILEQLKLFHSIITSPTFCQKKKNPCNS